MRKLFRFVLFVTFSGVFFTGLFLFVHEAQALGAFASHTPENPITADSVTIIGKGFVTEESLDCMESLTFLLDEDNNGTFEFSQAFTAQVCDRIMSKLITRSYFKPATINYRVVVKEKDNGILESTSTQTFSVVDSPTPTTSFDVLPLALNFGDVEVSKEKPLGAIIKNTGSGTITGSVSAQAPFSCDANCSYVLTAGKEQTVTILFRPTTTGGLTGTASFTANSLSKSILLQGNGTPTPTTSFDVVETSLDFGNVQAGLKKSLEVTVKNTGTTAIALNISAGTPFSCATNCSNVSIAPREERKVSILFEPTKIEPYIGNALFSSAGGPQDKVTLLGVGTAAAALPTLSVISNDFTNCGGILQCLNFGDWPRGDSSIKAVIIKNTAPSGSAALSGKISKIAGDNQFTCSIGIGVPPDNLDCPYSGILPGGTRNVNIKFSPNSIKKFESTLRFSNDSVSSDYVNILVVGQGVDSRVVDITPAGDVVNFGDVGLGQSSTKALMVRNITKEALNVSTALSAILGPQDIPGEQAFVLRVSVFLEELVDGPVLVSSENFTIPAESYATIDVSFRPQNAKTYTSSLTFRVKSGTKFDVTLYKSVTGKGKASPEPIIIPPPGDGGGPPPEPGIQGDLCIGSGFEGKQAGQDALSFIEYGKFYNQLSQAERAKVDGLLSAPKSNSTKGLVVCGRSCDDPTTKNINEAALCRIDHIFFLAQTIINNLLFIWMPIFLAIIIVGAGFMLMTSVANPEKRKAALRTIKWAVLGYGFTLSSWVIINGVLALLGIHANFSDWWNNIPEP